MLFVPEKIHAPSFEFNQPEIQVVENATYSGKQQPTADAFESFVFEQRVIPIEGGKQVLRLSKPLTLRMNFDTMRFNVIDWGIEMDSLDLPGLPRELARRFLKLLNSAQNEHLTESEQADWLRILDYIDFQQFSIDRSAPRYMEGILRNRSGVVIVEWHDENRERLNHNVVPALNEVNVGEKFSAFVKIGKNDVSLEIERVSLLQNTNAPEDWESWPPKK